MAAWGYKTKNGKRTFSIDFESIHLESLLNCEMTKCHCQGPALWKKDFPVAEGPRQSPISMHSKFQSSKCSEKC